MMTRFLALIAALIVLTPAAQAQSRRELAERIDATEVRIGALEDSFLAGDPVAERLMQQMEALQYQLQSLNGEVERLAFENRQLRERLDEMEAQQSAQMPASLIDPDAAAFMSEGLSPEDLAESGLPLEARGDAIVDPADPYAAQRAAATGTLGAGDTALAEPDLPDADALFSTAQTRLIDGDFEGAQQDFRVFLDNYAEDARAGQAWFWLGETYLVRNGYGDAADAFIASLRTDPSGEKAPDAMVKLATSLRGLDRMDDACQALARLDRQFPDASQSVRDNADREALRSGCR